MDSRTLIFCILLIVGFYSLIHLILWKTYPHIGGLRYWFWGYISAFLNILLFLISPPIPPALYVALLQILLLGAGIGCLLGIASYVEARISYRVIWATLVITLIVSLVLDFFDVSHIFIFGLGSTVSGVFFIWASRVGWPETAARYPARFLFSLTTLAHGVFLFVRNWVLLHAKAHFLFWHNQWHIEQVILLEQLIVVNMFSLSMILLVNERHVGELRQLAEYDFLTNVYNRRAFLKSLDQASSFAKRTNTPLSVLIFDIDHFKNINDSYGHDVGDMILKSVSESAVQALRTEDVMGRMGGEEFAIFLPNTEIQAALVVAERIRETVAAKSFTVKSNVISCSISIGVSELSAHETITNVLRRGDQAMYLAKAYGRNRTHCATA